MQQLHHFQTALKFSQSFTGIFTLEESMKNFHQPDQCVTPVSHDLRKDEMCSHSLESQPTDISFDENETTDNEGCAPPLKRKRTTGSTIMTKQGLSPSACFKTMRFFRNAH